MFDCESRAVPPFLGGPKAIEQGVDGMLPSPVDRRPGRSQTTCAFRFCQTLRQGHQSVRDVGRIAGKDVGFDASIDAFDDFVVNRDRSDLVLGAGAKFGKGSRKHHVDEFRKLLGERAKAIDQCDGTGSGIRGHRDVLERHVETVKAFEEDRAHQPGLVAE